MDPLDLVKLIPLMKRTSGSPEVKIGIIDGPVVTQHADLTLDYLHKIPGNRGATCTQANSAACLHGTFVASILSTERTSLAPAICPNCTLLIYPIFTETTTEHEHIPNATSKELAAAILDCIDANAKVINLSFSLTQPSTKQERMLEESLNLAIRRIQHLTNQTTSNQGEIPWQENTHISHPFPQLTWEPNNLANSPAATWSLCPTTE